MYTADFLNKSIILKNNDPKIKSAYNRCFMVSAPFKIQDDFVLNFELNF
ncbi:hypothetical protein LEP1GSC083_3198 [Leptospira interrogans serovar Pyrogenes str. L0374]|uniref:Uncharacterized protein n=3 Tax=Leptospira interrogans TaxID=173 RepID=A0A0E2D1J3_LEPIR|nr:hypothetical protein LEP1GSC077_0136 [Leptospira interrogans str. C10069]EKR53724.1 hypothetical protein LEP1GSC105_0344 [Leptospira interrogans str. UI 12758]EMN33007.1 hypothetical protein LEP1GSC083_3198 [Leptospira interrogans serovar Pyrogenes str. L0374]EMN61134.1 hypothetical protein LEP1GSC092_1936 [Leptospira interrogans serovar Pyrogenes str. R168]EMO96179.1 hypothetical protein LEP1GSC109_3436 [Leptospira interrogans str. UI 13372]EMP06934.1 hypothetical protein LEP1GSC124_3342 [